MIVQTSITMKNVLNVVQWKIFNKLFLHIIFKFNHIFNRINLRQYLYYACTHVYFSIWQHASINIFLKIEITFFVSRMHTCAYVLVCDVSLSRIFLSIFYRVRPAY